MEVSIMEKIAGGGNEIDIINFLDTITLSDLTLWSNWMNLGRDMGKNRDLIQISNLSLDKFQDQFDLKSLTPIKIESSPETTTYFFEHLHDETPEEFILHHKDNYVQHNDESDLTNGGVAVLLWI